MDNLIDIKNYLIDQIEYYTIIMSKCRLEENHEIAYHFECQRKAFIEVLDYVTDQIQRLEKGDK